MKNINEKINATQNNLVGNWFHTIKKGETNNPILLCIGLTYETEILIKDNLLHISHNQEHEKFFTIVHFKDLLLIENDFKRHHILYSNSSIDFKLLANINRPIICMILDTAKNKHLKIDIGFADLILNCDKYSNKPILQAKEKYSLIIKKRNPIKILQQDSSSIKALLYFFIYNEYIAFHNLSKILFRGHRFELERDLDYLSEKMILTSRLAIIIYKLATLSDDNDKTIGNYYSEKLGITSKKKTYKLFSIDSKCYDLNKSPLFQDSLIEGEINE
jgi:hypothetical protein